MASRKRTRASAAIDEEAKEPDVKRTKGAEALPPLPEFPSPFLDRENNYDVGRNIKTIKEKRMIRLSAAIRKKDDWQTKMEKKEIVAQWKGEAKQQGVTPDMIQYVLDELKYYLKLKDGAIEPSVVDGVWQADGLVSEELRLELLKGVAPLENVPKDEKDWHPGSKEQVLDLVHPSLFCLVYGVTTATAADQPCLPSLPLMGHGTVIPAPAAKEQPPVDFSSTRYQWLPSEFAVGKDGKVKIGSYINNLHPIEHKGLYRTIGAVFERMVPLFERCLTTLAQPPRSRLSPPWHLTSFFEDDADDEDWEANQTEEWYASQIPVPTKVVPVLDSIHGSQAVSLRGRNLQVIVKLANIVLTPKKPNYKGGTWHVEGMENERIVASGIYYYMSENITESVLEFREAIVEPDGNHGGHGPITLTYGLKSWGALNQQLGGVVTKQDRCLVFPNLFQHQVQPFSLADKKKPGIRKILVFFLIDPNHKITSTLHVPPQQAHWYGRWLRTQVHAFRRLPAELVDLIAKFAQMPMSMEAAKEHREALMNERKFSTDNVTKTVFQREFSLCEH